METTTLPSVQIASSASDVVKTDENHSACTLSSPRITMSLRKEMDAKEKTNCREASVNAPSNVPCGDAKVSESNEAGNECSMLIPNISHQTISHEH